MAGGRGGEEEVKVEEEVRWAGQATHAPSLLPKLTLVMGTYTTVSACCLSLPESTRCMFKGRMVGGPDETLKPSH